MRARLIQTSMIGGELSRGARARHDIEAYPNALERCRNAIVRTTGAADKRGGFVHLGSAAFTGGAALWITFRKSTSDVVRILVCGGLLRFWDGIARQEIKNAGVPISISSPWSDADLPHLRWFQSGDVIWIDHNLGTHPRRVLKRHSPTLWTLDAFVFEDGPWGGFERGSTLAFSGVSGSVVVTCSAARFAAGHVGALIRIEATRFDDVLTWSFDNAYLTSQIVRHGHNFYECVQKGSIGKAGDAPPIHTEGDAWDGSAERIKWKYLGSTHAVLRITDIISQTQVEADVLNRLPYYGAMTKQASRWRLGAFSDADGWPRAGVISDERMGAFGSVSAPDTAHLSATAGYNPDSASYDPGYLTEVVDDDAITRTAADSEVNPVTAALMLDALILFTQGGVKRLAPPSPDEALTPAGATSRSLVDIPCSELVRPVKTATSFIYAPFHETELIEVQRGDAIEPRNLAELADHFVAAGVRTLAWSRWPSRTLWVLDREGQLASLTYSPENRIFAWSGHAIGGELGGDQVEIDDISSAPGPYRSEEVWACMRRTVNGVTTRTIEYMERTFNPRRMRLEDACCLDAAGYFDCWNHNPALTLTFAPLGPGHNTGSLIAGGHAPFTPGHVGREVWMRRVKPTPRASDGAWPERYVVTGYASATEVYATAIGHPLDRLGLSAWAGWAIPTQRLTGLGWLEGRAVRLNLDGGDRGPRDDGADAAAYTVTGGALDLPEFAARGWVGEPYTQHLRSLPPNAGEASGAARGAPKRLDMAYLMIDGAAAGVLKRVGVDSEAGVRIAPRSDVDIMGAIAKPKDEDVLVELPGGFDEAGQLELLNDTALPCGVAGWAYRVATNG
jgi:hypothetical protein